MRRLGLLGLVARLSLTLGVATFASEAPTGATVGGEPLTMPESGGAAFPLEAVLIGLGTLTAAAGVYLQRRKAA